MLISNVSNSILSENDAEAQNSLIGDFVDKFNAAVMHDAYTGLYNKLYAEEKLVQIVKNWIPNQHVSVIIFDIDNFKLIHDSYGHLQGDDVIQTLADELKREYKRFKWMGMPYWRR